MDEKKTGVAKALKFFGKKDGQSLSDFAAEWKALSETDQRQLVTGIENGTFTY